MKHLSIMPLYLSSSQIPVSHIFIIFARHKQNNPGFRWNNLRTLLVLFSYEFIKRTAITVLLQVVNESVLATWGCVDTSVQLLAREFLVIANDSQLTLNNWKRPCYLSRYSLWLENETISGTTQVTPLALIAICNLQVIIGTRKIKA